MNLTKEEVLDLLIICNAVDSADLRLRVMRAHDELVHSEVEFPCVAYWMKGKEVWASNRVEKGAQRISLELYRALRPGFLSSKYPPQLDVPIQNQLEL